LSRLSEKLRTTFSRLVLEWGMSPRYLANQTISYRIVTTGREKRFSRFIDGLTYDLSESGIGILTNSITIDGFHAYFSNDMISSTQLEIKLELPDKTVMITGQTCRYQKMEANRLLDYNYLLGVKILNISEEDKNVYEKFIVNIRRDPERRSPHYQ
jgi:hypothetical protein